MKTERYQKSEKQKTNRQQKIRRGRGIRTIALFLILLLLSGSMAGCGSEKETKEKKETAMGRFLEEEILLPDGITQIDAAGRTEDGTLIVLGNGENIEERKLFYSKDKGKSWEEQKLPEQLDNKHCSYLYRAAVSKSGQIFATGSFENDKFENWMIEPDGTGRKLEIPLAKLEGSGEESGFQTDSSEEEDGESETKTLDNIDNFITQAAFADNGSLYAMDLDNNVYQVNTDNGEVEDIYENDGDQRLFGIGGNYLILAGSKKITLYNIDTGEELSEDTVLTEELLKEGIDSSNSDSLPVLFSGNEDGIFYATHKGVYYHAIGGSVTEQLINGELNTMGNPSTEFFNLWYVDQEHFILQCRDEQGISRLYQYSYSDTTPSVPEKELTVYSLEDTNEIRQAISMFQKENQDIYVNLEIGKSNDDAVTADDALRTLNTDILAGKGPDVLILDGMPVDNYIEKGLLADITDVKDEIAREDGLFENICDIYQKDGKIYGLPSRFLFSYVQGTQEDVKNCSTLSGLEKQVKTLKEKDKKKNVTLLTEKDVLLKQLFDVESANLKKEDNTIDEQRLTDFYEAAKTIYEANTESKDRNRMNLNYEGAGTTIGTVGCLDYLRGNISLNMGTIGSDTDIIMLTSVNQSMKKKNVDFDLLAGGEKKSFIPRLAAGINSKSKNQEEARLFLKTLLGKEAGSVIGDGISVNKKAYEEMIKTARTQGENSGFSISSGDGDVFSYTMSPLIEQDEEKVKHIIEALDTAAWTDAVIVEMVVSQGEKYLDGTQSVSETVKNVMQKVNLYLSE